MPPSRLLLVCSGQAQRIGIFSRTSLEFLVGKTQSILNLMPLQVDLRDILLPAPRDCAGDAGIYARLEKFPTYVRMCSHARRMPVFWGRGREQAFHSQLPVPTTMVLPVEKTTRVRAAAFGPHASAQLPAQHHSVAGLAAT